MQILTTQIHSSGRSKSFRPLATLLLLLLIAFATTFATKSHAIDPVTAAAAANSAKDILKDLPKAWRWTQSEVRKVRRGDGSVTEIIDIIPTFDNGAIIDLKTQCGYRVKNRWGFKFVQQVKLFYFDQEIGSRSYSNSEAQRSVTTRFEVRDIIPASSIEAALAAGRSELPVEIVAWARCETYDNKKRRFRGKHPDFPKDSQRVSIVLPDIQQQIAEQKKAEQKKKAASAKRTNPKSKKDNQKKNKATQVAKNKKPKWKKPNLQIKVSNQAKATAAKECPRHVHFTGMIRFNGPGVYTYYFEGEDGSRTKGKTITTDGAGDKEFYWNRRISKPKNTSAGNSFTVSNASSSTKQVKGWTRINVRAGKTKKNRKLFKSEPVKFTTTCR